MKKWFPITVLILVLIIADIVIFLLINQTVCSSGEIDRCDRKIKCVVHREGINR